MWKINPQRIFEHLTEDRVNEAARGLASVANKPVLKALLLFWGVFLALVFTLLLTVRLALTLPIYG